MKGLLEHQTFNIGIKILCQTSMIRESFPTGKSARDWEDKVLRRLKVGRNDQWLNKKRPRLAMIASVTGLKRSDEAKKNYSKATKGTLVALNIETGVTTRIPTELFHSRKDIYFHASSKEYRKWKANTKFTTNNIGKKI